MLEKNYSEKISEIFITSIKQYFRETLKHATFPDNTDISFSIAKDEKFGDLSTNAAMRLSKIAGKDPRQFAEEIAMAVNNDIRLNNESRGIIEKVTAEKGFINVWLSKAYYKSLLLAIKKTGEKFGKCDIGEGKTVNLEFLSANPTGPLTIAHGRQAAVGDSLSRILSSCGFKVTREYYLNDFGRQINLLGRSLEVRYKNLFNHNLPMPEDGYMGDYMITIAEKLKEERKASLLAAEVKVFTDYAVEYIMGLIKKDLKDFRVSFDVWTSQAAMEKNNSVMKALDKIKEKSYLYEKDGALWFRSTDFGDDKDRVVKKSDGSFTYLGPDIAYHDDKFRRGFDRLIDLLGPDHHGYIKRMKAAVMALGHPEASIDILIVQLVTLLRGGRTLSMSTRQGQFVTLREVIDEVGTDVARFFFLTRKLDSHLDFDIDIAKKESNDNPVYYIQYAHARICSIKRYAEKMWYKLFLVRTDLDLLTHQSEKSLIRKLDEFPLAIRISAETLEPSRLITYLIELAKSFHSFYTNCRVVSDDIKTTKARLFLVDCARIVLSNGLGIMNISLPEKM